MGIFDLDYAIRQFPEVLKAVPMTMLIAVVAMVLGCLLGSAIALIRIYKVPVLHRLAQLYVSFIRGTPILVQIYIIYFGLPDLVDLLHARWGFPLTSDYLPPLLVALLAFTINSAAYQSEVVRAGFQAIDYGQMEAAYSVGMTTPQALRRIILHQALLVSLPNLGNIFLNLIKGTSLAFTVKVIEIMAAAKISASEGYNYIEMYVDAALVYWIICFAIERLLAWLEKRLSRHERRLAV
ncbi:amino acid ABC transporter permease [Paenibacillus sp. NPDC058071]|uniref:amino acid ABC transporter permease n=1 Tax=Paenibacillus sp. NPDC058071 TaxID=3346326 RepID=UPI0036DF76DB